MVSLKREKNSASLKLRRSLFEARRAKKDWVRGDFVDLDQDRVPEILLRSRFLTLLLDVNRGGQLLELRDPTTQVNLMDSERILAGRSQAQNRHRPHRWPGLVDHIFAPGTKVQAFARGEAEELGDFAHSPYRGRLKPSPGLLQAVLTRDGEIRERRKPYPVTLTKTVGLSARNRTVTLKHRLINRSKQKLAFLFGCELQLNLKDVHVNRTGEAQGVRRFSVVDPAVSLQVDWAFRRPVRFWYFPKETVPRGASDSGRIYEGVNLTCLWPVSLASFATWSAQWELTVGAANDGS